MISLDSSHLANKVTRWQVVNDFLSNFSWIYFLLSLLQQLLTNAQRKQFKDQYMSLRVRLLGSRANRPVHCLLTPWLWCLYAIQPGKGSDPILQLPGLAHQCTDAHSGG